MRLSIAGLGWSLAAALLISITAPAQAVNLIVDGDFENPNLGGPGFLVVNSGNTVGAWLVGNDPNYGTGNNVTLEHFPALPQFFPWLTAHGGLQYLDLTGVANQPGSLCEQVVPTIPGQYYTLSYWAGSANSPNHTFPITITALVIDHNSSTTLLTDNFTTTATPAFQQVIWEPRALPMVQATSTQTRIRFRNSFSSQDACLLDDIVFERQLVSPTDNVTWGAIKATFGE